MALAELKALKEKAYAKTARPDSKPGGSGAGARLTQGAPRRGTGGQPNMGARMGVLLERIKAGRQ